MRTHEKQKQGNDNDAGAQRPKKRMDMLRESEEKGQREDNRNKRAKMRREMGWGHRLL